MASKISKRRNIKTTIPLAIVGGFVPFGLGLWNRRSSAVEMGHYAQQAVTMIDPAGDKFNLGNFRLLYLPLMAGFIAHTVATKFGLNRALSRAKIPLFRI